MTFLPIFSRELAARARGQANYWTRFCIGLAGVLLCVQSMESSAWSTPSAMGTFVFNGIVGAAFLVSCSACLLTADAISAEWREGTLGLLFLTRVKVLDILLGKFASIGTAGLCALIAFLPVLMVPILAGGVTGGEGVRKALGLFDALLLALVVGLFSSAAERERSRAVRRAFFLLGALVILPFFAYVGWGRGIFFYAGLFSPLVLLARAGDLNYTSSPAAFWCSFVIVQAVSWGLLVLAGRRLKRAVANEGGISSERPRPSKEQVQRAIGLGVWQPAKEDATPVEWLVYRQYGVHAAAWTIGVLALACNAWVPLVRQAQGLPSGPFFLAVASPLGTVSGLIGGAMVAWVASRFFVGVRRTGDLELLLTTPVGAQSVVQDQWKVLQRLFAWPVLFMQAPVLPQMLRGNFSPVELVTVANSFLGAAALCWLGLWFGLRSRTQAGAIVWSVGLGKGLPSLFSLICSISAGAMTNLGNRSLSSSAVSWWVPELAILAFYLWVIATAKINLEREIVGREISIRLRPER